MIKFRVDIETLYELGIVVEDRKEMLSFAIANGNNFE